MNQLTSKSTTAFESHDTRKRFGVTEIIRGINPTIGKDERHALTGPNGASKSTTFNPISGRFPVSSGSVRLSGEEISGLAPFEINRKGLPRSFQITNIFHRLSVFENLCYAALWSPGYKYSFWHELAKLRDACEHAEEVLEQIDIAYRREAAVGLLTYAKQRVLEIDITIADGADVILLDEPTVDASHSESNHAVELIRKVTVGKTLMIVECGMSIVFSLADRVSVLVYSKVIATDTPEAIRNSRRVREAYLGITLNEPTGAH